MKIKSYLLYNLTSYDVNVQKTFVRFLALDAPRMLIFWLFQMLILGEQTFFENKDIFKIYISRAIENVLTFNPG